ncbi:transcription factor bHLH123-like isoform X1 [Typha latifolia]|uniref:transcription factor bHLH123-like isoform X1 n=1 Tax=Typha latifolia TaxID=4733 RepID=UPI003C2EAFA6
MWNDAVFSSLSGPLGDDFGSSESARLRYSNAAVELERLFVSDLFSTSHDFDGFQHQLENFSSSLPLPVEGEGDSFMGTADDISGASQGMSKGKSSLRGTKRLKKTHGEKLQRRSASDEPTAKRTQLMKAPVRRSQKLGDKITALQQLVSPFGKTDTASVLHEASICIKFLHQQIQIMTAPYCGIKSSAPQQTYGEGLGLRSRGLCLVPVSPAIINLTSQAAVDRCTPEITPRRTGFHL